MTTESKCNNGLEQSQACPQREMDPTSSRWSEDDEIERADVAADEEARIRPILEQLNQSTISDLVKIANDQPAVDLCSYLREAARTYKTKRAEYSPKPAVESKASTPDTDDHLKHVVHAEGDISVLWPLAPSVASLLHMPPLSGTSVPFQSTQQAAISRSALSSLLKEGELLFQQLQRAVVRIATDIVVKVSRSDDVTEVMNLEHIHAASRTIPVPRPLGMLLIAQDSYIFTSFVTGIPLDRIWANLASPQKATIRQQLDTILKELRALPIPSKDRYFGGGDPPLCLDNRRWIRRSSSSIVSEAQFNDFLLSEAHATPNRVEFIRACLRNDHRIVMTHGDLHPRNMIVDNEQEVKITGIIDWEVGGGYPEYWEYVKALHTAFTEDEDDWHLFLPEAAIGKYIDEYTRDYVVGRMVS